MVKNLSFIELMNLTSLNLSYNKIITDNEIKDLTSLTENNKINKILIYRWSN